MERCGLTGFSGLRLIRTSSRLIRASLPTSPPSGITLTLISDTLARGEVMLASERHVAKIQCLNGLGLLTCCCRRVSYPKLVCSLPRKGSNHLNLQLWPSHVDDLRSPRTLARSPSYSSHPPWRSSIVAFSSPKCKVRGAFSCISLQQINPSLQTSRCSHPQSRILFCRRSTPSPKHRS
jgi:hypothetical protein